MRHTRKIFLVVALIVPAFAFAEGDVRAIVSISGAIQLQKKNKTICTLNAGAYDKAWKHSGANGNWRDEIKDSRPFTIKTQDGTLIRGDAKVEMKDGKFHAAYSFTPQADVALSSIHLAADFPVAKFAETKWKAGDKSGEFTSENREQRIFAGTVRSLMLEPPHAPRLIFSFDEPTQVLLQDNRQWSPDFVLRIGPETGETLKKDQKISIAFTLESDSSIEFVLDRPVTIQAGPDWIPLAAELDIEAGSALDFSKLGFLDAPAGKHGRVIANPKGFFAFETSPETPRRFYGVNFCFSSQFLSHEQSDRLAERLARLGYNAVRMHHYEGELAQGQPDSTQFNPDKLDQFDYLLAACRKRGIYVTTDLFVSRPVAWKAIGIDKPGNVPMDTFKHLVQVHPGAMANYKAFAKNLLDHKNPHTGLRYADDPALAWLCLINEGNPSNFVADEKKFPEWTAAWNAWLVKRYPTRDALVKGWGNEVTPEDDPAKGTVGYPDNIYASTFRARDGLQFLAQTERATVENIKRFLREELGCKALLTNMNAWTYHVSDQSARETYDYVDDHFYVDHPHFIERPWSLPSRCDNNSPVAGGATGGRHCAFTRMFGKPFTVTEYNYSGPGRFRGVGGILTGAMGALQGWDGIWRFAYSHDAKTMFTPGRMDYFNMANDPLSQAAERASICLFLRGDLKPAPHSICIAMTPKDLENAPKATPKIEPKWNWAAWVTRVGTALTSDPKSLNDHTMVIPLGWGTPAKEFKPLQGVGADPYSSYTGTLDYQKELALSIMSYYGIAPQSNICDVKNQIFFSETDEIMIDAPADKLVLDTPRTAGGYATSGQILGTQNGVLITIVETDATVWVSSLDDAPITKSKRLLVTHLTDLQNTEISYAESARKTLLGWGKLPHLVRAGKARIRIEREDAAELKVWALSTGGKRSAEIPATATPRGLEFTADVAADPQNARMLYEIAPK